MLKRNRVVYSDSEEEDSPEPKRNHLRGGHNESRERLPILPVVTPIKLTPNEYALEIASFIKTGNSALFTGNVSSIEVLRQTVHAKTVGILGVENFERINIRQLRMIYEVIDCVYFKGTLEKLLKFENRVLSFRLSSKMTQRAGQLFTDKRSPLHHELSISSFLLFESFSPASSSSKREVVVNGLRCENRLQCLLRIMEHETVHLLFCCDIINFHLNLFDSKGKYFESFHGKTFQRTVKAYFGHTDWQHSLVTRDEIAFVRRGIEVGAEVSFKHEGEKLIGKVNRVQKRVTVLVKCDHKNVNAKLFSDGKMYAKYYVPVNACTVL